MRETALTVDAGPEKMNRRQAAKVKTRQKVLESARGLFAERGYEPATIRDIAKGAGMSTGAVFANFQDKAELFEAVLSEDMASLADTMRRGASNDGGLKDRLQSVLEAGYHAGLDQLPLMQAIVARSWFQPRAAEMRARGAVKGLLAVVSETLQAGVRDGDLPQDADVRLLTEMIWDAYLSNYRKAAYDDFDITALSQRLSRQLDVILAGASQARAA